MKSLVFSLGLLLMASMCNCRFFHQNISENSGIKAHRISDAKLARNTILVIADGMGANYLEALHIYQGFKKNVLEKFSCKTMVNTCSLAESAGLFSCNPNTKNVTDSAAAATAMATGFKVQNKVISLDTYNNLPIKTILEVAQEQEKSTGIVVTKLISDATPAAFAAHAKTRHDTEDILKSMFGDVKPNLILGADDPLHQKYARSSNANYLIFDKFSKFEADIIDGGVLKSCHGTSCPFIYGGFGTHDLIPGNLAIKMGLPLEITPQEYFVKKDVPHLSQMAKSALKILSQNQQGFFLMIESSMTDIIGHYNKVIDENIRTPSAINVLVREMLELEKTLHEVIKFAEENDDTLVLFTSDHETGGLNLSQSETYCYGKSGCIPHAQWTAGYSLYLNWELAKHTGQPVPLYVFGKDIGGVCKESRDNTDIYKTMTGQLK